jgi:hypothetical protein
LEPTLTRHEWEDVQGTIKNLLTEGESGLVAPSPNKFDDYCRKYKTLLPRSKRILEHFELPDGRLGWVILMEREFNARITPPYGESSPRKSRTVFNGQTVFDVLANTKNSAADYWEDTVIDVADGELEQSAIDELIDVMKSNPVYL